MRVTSRVSVLPPAVRLGPPRSSYRVGVTTHPPRFVKPIEMKPYNQPSKGLTQGDPLLLKASTTLLWAPCGVGIASLIGGVIPLVGYSQGEPPDRSLLPFAVVSLFLSSLAVPSIFMIVNDTRIEQYQRFIDSVGNNLAELRKLHRMLLTYPPRERNKFLKHLLSDRRLKNPSTLLLTTKSHLNEGTALD